MNKVFFRLISEKEAKASDGNLKEFLPDLGIGVKYVEPLECPKINIPLRRVPEGISKASLYDLALTNMTEEYNPHLFRLADLVNRIMGGSDFPEAPDVYGSETPLEDDLYVLSHSDEPYGIGTYGASVILMPGVLESVAKRMGGAIYILLSSVHEVIIVPGNQYDLEMLKETVHSVNSTVVAEDDFLSDNVYEYTLGGKLQIVTNKNAVAM